MKTKTKTQTIDEIIKFLLDCHEPYEDEDETKTNARQLVDKFLSEYRELARIQGWSTGYAAKQWLLGLAINTPYTYHDIAKVMIDWGLTNDEETALDVEFQDRHYWNCLAMGVAELVRQHAPNEID